MEDKLKIEICERYKRNVSSSRDCSSLSIAIHETTRRNISPTTLRRFFGLLPSKSGFSRYNLDTLSIYAGYPDYASFCKKEDKKKYDKKNSLQIIRNEIIQTTRYTLASISRKAMTDFSSTIPRKMLNMEIDGFIQSNHFVFPLIAPGGYGKSTALAHWVISAQNNHLVYFVSASFFYPLISGSGNTNRFSSLNLEKVDNIYNVFIRESGKTDEKLVLVIDALDEISAEPEKLLHLMNYILDTASLFAESTKVKIIISVREAVWQYHLGNLFKKHEEIQWFAEINPSLESGYTNMPFLSNSEISEIISVYNKTNPSLLIYESIPWDLREVLKKPINLYFANELLKNGKTPERISQLDITREFIKEYVFRGKFAEQKEDIVWSILELLESSEESSEIAKNDLKMTLPIHLKRETAYFQAYNELLHAGILNEEREENRYGIYQTKISFKHQTIQQYLYSLQTIKENGGMSKQLFIEVCNSRRNTLWVSQVIAILYEIAYDEEDYESISDFCELPEVIIKSFIVTNTVGNSFRKKNSITNKLIEHSDFFTLDVADYIGKKASDKEISNFVQFNSKYLGNIQIPGVNEIFRIDDKKLTAIAHKFLFAVKQAGVIYRHIESKKGKGNFVAEVSMDEVSEAQSPIEMFFILSAIAAEGIPAQTIAPKFTGRFNKGVDYVGDVNQFAKEFEQDLLVIDFAIKEFGLPKNLKLSVHSGSDKFSIYPVIGLLLKKYNKGIHVKTAGTTWLEEAIGLSLAGRDALQLVKDIYIGGLNRFDELCGPYATVIDIDKSKLPGIHEVETWDGNTLADTLRHIP